MLEEQKCLLSNHFWERNLRAQSPCSRTPRWSCTCYCLPCHSWKWCRKEYQSNFHESKAEKHADYCHYNTVRSISMTTLHLITADASPLPPLRGCFSSWSMYCQCSGISPRLAHFIFRYHQYSRWGGTWIYLIYFFIFRSIYLNKRIKPVFVFKLSVNSHRHQPKVFTFSKQPSDILEESVEL